MPEMLHRVGVDRADRKEHDGEKRRGPDQRLDPDQFGAQHLLHQGVRENRPVPPRFAR